MGGLDYGELEEGELDAPAASTLVTPAASQYLAGWAGGGSVPPPARPAGGFGYGAATARYASHLGAGGPHTTGKDGRDGSKRMRTGRNGWVDTSAGSNAHKPCVFFIQGHCKNGSKCGYLHGDSPLPCHMFNTRAGCKFGDKCAFRHVPPAARVGKNGVSTDRDAAPAVRTNPFGTHASNCGCLVCHPPPPRRVTYVEAEGDGDDDEDGEVLEVVEEPEEPTERAGERVKDPGEIAERDAVLRRCSVIETPAETASWREFLADAERNAGSGNGLAPFWKLQEKQRASTASGSGRGAGT